MSDRDSDTIDGSLSNDADIECSQSELMHANGECLSLLYYKLKIILEIKSNAYSEALQYRQDLYYPLPQENTLSYVYTCCSENHNNTFAENQKIRGLNFILCSSAEKNLNMDAQLQTIAYIKPPKLLLKIARLNRQTNKSETGEGNN